ncbi:hypothetical protein FKM82_017443 [Ascaphus truei]
MNTPRCMMTRSICTVHPVNEHAALYDDTEYLYNSAPDDEHAALYDDAGYLCTPGSARTQYLYGTMPMGNTALYNDAEYLPIMNTPCCIMMQSIRASCPCIEILYTDGDNLYTRVQCKG